MIKRWDMMTSCRPDNWLSVLHQRSEEVLQSWQQRIHPCYCCLVFVRSHGSAGISCILSQDICEQVALRMFQTCKSDSVHGRKRYYKYWSLLLPWGWVSIWFYVLYWFWLVAAFELQEPYWWHIFQSFLLFRDTHFQQSPNVWHLLI